LRSCEKLHLGLFTHEPMGSCCVIGDLCQVLHIRSDNGPEFTEKVVQKWLGRLGVMTLFIEPGSPWEKGYIESFNARLKAFSCRPALA
jgi:hypothetical protein